VERLSLIEYDSSELSVAKQAELLGLNRSSLYYKPVPPDPMTVIIRHKIDEIYTKSPYFGSRRITAILNKSGIGISRPTVQKHMRDMGIYGIFPKKNFSKKNPEHKIYPYLLRNITASYPNHIWGTDITYLPMKNGWMYLVAYMDWFSRYVISWEVDQTLEIPFVIEALEKALKIATPNIVNSDQGSHFTSPKHTKLLLNSDVKISMDGRGRAMDNIFTERLWRSLKYEKIYLHEY
jgi:putative transposase